jgi:hypothetical protein
MRSAPLEGLRTRHTSQTVAWRSHSVVNTVRVQCTTAKAHLHTTGQGPDSGKNNLSFTCHSCLTYCCKHSCLTYCCKHKCLVRVQLFIVCRQHKTGVLQDMGELDILAQIREQLKGIARNRWLQSHKWHMHVHNTVAA